MLIWLGSVLFIKSVTIDIVWSARTDQDWPHWPGIRTRWSDLAWLQAYSYQVVVMVWYLDPSVSQCVPVYCSMSVCQWYHYQPPPGTLYVDELTNNPVVLWVVWRQRRQGEREMWCWWNCKYQPWAPRPFQHPQVSFTVTRRTSNGPVLTWLLGRYPSYHPSLLHSPPQHQSQSLFSPPGKPVPANNFSHETYWTGENPSRQICLYNFYDRLKPNWVKIFSWGVKSQHSWLASDSIRIGIIHGYRGTGPSTVNHVGFKIFFSGKARISISVDRFCGKNSI